MAKSENQGLQVAVIIFAFLTIALSVATFYFFNEYSTAYTNSVEMNQKADDELKRARAFQDDRNALMAMIGFATEKKVADVKPEFDKALGKIMNTIKPAAKPEEKSQNCMQALEFMVATVEQLKTETRREDALLTKLGADIKKAQEDYEAAGKATQAFFEGEKKQFEERLTTYASTDQKHVAEVDRLTKDLQGKRDELQKFVNDKTAEIQKIQGELKKAMDDAKKANEMKYEVLNQTFERPDGKIVIVNPRENTVWIDVGRADSLRLNLRFTVYDRGENNVYKRTPKGTIEVKRFLGESMAEAYVTDSELKNPILKGDVIATPIWTPNNPERYVLAGDFDVNGDKKLDNDLMRQLVDMGGGIIDTELSIRTRYLLLGDPPAEKSAAEEYQKLHKKAKDLGIKIMTHSEFLDYTGGQDLMRRASALAAAEDAKETMKNKDRRAPGFRPRTPEDGARRLEPGASPKPGRKEPDRRRGPVGAKSNGDGSAYRD